MADKNKVKFNLCNVHYAPLTFEGDTPVYGEPVAMPGAVSLSLDANGEPENFYADGYAYYTLNNNMGYDGDLELAMITEQFRLDNLGEALDDNGVLIENTSSELGRFALLFEFDGDKKHIRHALYNCTASRPAIEGKTNEESREVQTETLTIKASPLPDGRVKGKTGDATTTEIYENWYNAVYLSQASGGSVALATLSIGSLTLTPAFDPEVRSYAVTTENDADAVAASTAGGGTVTILVNGAVHTSGQSATWNAGENTVSVIVVNGGNTRSYVVNVTQEEA